MAILLTIVFCVLIKLMCNSHLPSTNCFTSFQISCDFNVGQVSAGKLEKELLYGFCLTGWNTTVTLGFSTFHL